MFNEFLDAYGMEIIYGVVTAIATYLAFVVKSLVTKYLNDKTKKNVAKTVVQAIEQIYKDLHGEEKLNKALEYMAEMLTAKGITTTEIELRVLLEDAVGEFNKVFEKENTKEEE